MNQKQDNIIHVDMPVGYHNFHNEDHINFQLNRWYSAGYTSLDDVVSVADRLKDFDDWKREWITIARRAEKEGRLLNAAFDYRAAEFFTYADDPDKDLLYDKFTNLFYEHMRNTPIQRYDIPYQDGAVYAIRITPPNPKGTVVIHGGGDSFAEEFYAEMVPFYEAGYDVINFEGPGQGKVLHKFHIPYTHQWEKPTKAVLDFFELDDVTLIGVSMGSWMCLRAASRIERIKRVISWSSAYDIWRCHLGRLPFAVRALLQFLFAVRARSAINRLLQKAREKNTFSDWAFDHGLYSFGKKDLYDYFSCWKLYRPAHMNPERIKQDVLLLSGEKDHFIPVEMMLDLEKDLVNAHSVEHRVYTESEQAAAHCQIGNLPLAIDEIISWIDRKSAHGAKERKPTALPTDHRWSNTHSSIELSR